MAGSLFQALAHFLGQFVLGFVLFLQQREGKVQITLVQSGPGILQGGFLQTILSGLVVRPEAQGLAIAEDRFRIVVVAFGGEGGLEPLPGQNGEPVAFLVFAENADGGLEILDGGIAVCGFRGHGLAGDVLEFTRRLGGGDLVEPGGRQGIRRVFAAHEMRGGTFEDFKEDGAEEIDVALRADPVPEAVGHFGGHIGRGSTQGGAFGNAQGGRAGGDGGGQAPVHEHHFAVFPQHDVLRLQVAVNDAAAVGEGDGIADPQQDVQVFLEGLVPNGVRPRTALEFLHGIEQMAGFIHAQVVNGDDVGMIQLSGDEGFGQEQRLPVLIIGLIGAHHFEGDGAGDGGLAGLVDQAHAALSQHAEQLEVAFGIRRTGGAHPAELDRRLSRHFGGDHMRTDGLGGHLFRDPQGFIRHRFHGLLKKTGGAKSFRGIRRQTGLAFEAFLFGRHVLLSYRERFYVPFTQYRRKKAPRLQVE